MAVHEDETMDEAQPPRQRKTKGRGFRDQEIVEVDNDRSAVESWVLFVSGVQEEAAEDDLVDIFGEFGEIKNIHLNLDRRTGYVKGYAIIEYGEQKEAEAAIANLNNRPMLDQTLSVDWAFTGAPSRKSGSRR